MPLLAPVITTTLSVIFDISIRFSLFKNLLFTHSCTPLNDRPCDFGNLFDQGGQETRYVRATRKIGTLPSPQRQEIRPARRLCGDPEGSEEASLQGIR